MYKRKIASLSVAFLLGTAAAEYRYMLLLYGVFALSAAVSAAAWTKKERKGPPQRAICFWLAFALAAGGGSYASISRQAFCGAYGPNLIDGKECALQGTVYQKHQEEESCLYYLKHCRVRLEEGTYPCENVLVYLKVFGYSIGETLLVTGTVKNFSQPSNEGGYDEKRDYQSRRFAFKMYAPKADAVYGRPDAPREWLCKLKEKLKESYRSAMPDADAGVMAAMALGDKSQMGAERKRIYQNAGISHFYSISGLHISLLGMAFYCFLKKCGAPNGVSCCLAAAWILGYGEMVGFGVSSSRAIGMFLLLLYAKWRGRSYDRPTALALLAAALACQNPGILHNVGYLLSFGAVAGVLLAEAVKGRRISAEGPSWAGIRAKMSDAVLVSVCIQLMSIPILCRYFYEIPVYAVLVNLVVLPCMAILLGVGLFGGVTGCFAPFAGKWLLYPCHVLLAVFDEACSAVLRLPGASFITGKLPAGKIVLWYGVIVLFLVLLNRKKMPPFFLLPFSLACLLLVRSAFGFEIDILDVGQGDGIYISAGDQISLFIDGGSTDVKNAGAYRILPFLKCRGIRAIDYWFVSHCDADHINGLCEVIEAGYPVKNLAVSEYMPDDEASRSLKKLALRHKIPILTMGCGDAVIGKKGNWAIKSLSRKTGDVQAGRNAASLILVYKSPECSAFFGGDIGKEQEKELLLQEKLTKVDVYKASHHGSDTSNGAELLLALQPKIAVISCALSNSYGHPGEEAVENMEQAGAKIYETRFGGQVKITGGGVERIGNSP